MIKQIDLQLLEACGDMQANGNDIESMLSFLRLNSCSIVHSIVIVAKLTNIDLDEVKGIVHNSKTWSDVREHHEKWHEELLKAIDESALSDTSLDTGF